MRIQRHYSKFTVTLMGVLLLFLGVTILSHAGSVTTFVVRLTGLACAAYGIIGIMSRVLKAYSLDAIPFENLTLEGILLLLGMVVALHPRLFTRVLFTLLGLLIVITGTGDIARSRTMAAHEEEQEKTALRIGLATVAVGVCVTLAPQATAHALPVACGLALVLDGLSELYLALRMDE